MAFILGFARALWSFFKWFTGAFLVQGALHFTGWFSLANLSSWITKKVMTAIGIGYVTFVGVGFAANEITEFIKRNFLELPTEVLQILGLAKVDIAFNIIMAGLMIRLYAMGLNNARDSVSKLGLIK